MRLVRFPVVLGMALVLLVTAWSPAAAVLPTSSWVWAVNRQPTASTVTPGPRDSSSSSGGAVTITRVAVGSWEIRAPGFPSVDGVALVTPIGKQARVCNVTRWSSDGGDFLGEVECWNPAGLNADTAFSFNWLEVSGPAGTQSVAYLWDNVPGNASFTPVNYWYNSIGGGITVTRNDEGQHRIQMGGMGVLGGFAFVGAYGTSPSSCALEDIWSSTGLGGDEVANVYCRDSGGLPADTRFSFLFLHMAGLEAYGTPRVYLYAGSPRKTSYVPIPTFSYTNGTQDRIRIRRTAKGTYVVQLTDQRSPTEYGGSAQVSTLSDASKRCQLSSIARRKTRLPMRIGVRCFDRAGTPVDAFFALAWTN